MGNVNLSEQMITSNLADIDPGNSKSSINQHTPLRGALTKAFSTIKTADTLL